MAIQMRRGLYQDFDPTKMLAGEWAIVTGGDPNTASGRAIYHAYAAGQVERVATYVDAAQIIINSIPDTVDALTQAVEQAEATRVLAEAARVQAEEARALAESGRASAETAREQKVITSATATADSGVGAPSVDVTLGQPSSLGRALDFAFHNIKGAKGDKGDKGDTVSVEPVTTSQIDTIAADGTVTSDLEALTATGLTYLWGKIKAAFAALTHSHAASDITSGTLTVARGGTGASDASGARTSLGVPSTTDVNNLEASLASVEQSTATASHATGSHFILDGILRKATSAIATGESITNSNSTTDTVQAQIDTLRDSLDLRLATGGMLTGNNNLNDLTVTGIYYNGGYTPTNSPVTGGYWYLLNITYGMKYQIIFNNDAIYIRRYAANAWQSWAKASLTWL